MMMRAVERQQRVAQARKRGNELAHVARLHVMLLEDRVRQRFHQVAGQALVAVIGEARDLDPKLVGELHQHTHRHRTAVALDQIEVAGRDAKLTRHVGLREAPFLPQAAQLAADLHRLHRSASVLQQYDNLQRPFCKSVVPFPHFLRLFRTLLHCISYESRLQLSISEIKGHQR
jgi:hypothetical protein